MIFVKHVGCSSLDLRINYLVPKPLGLDCLTTTAFLLVPDVELLEFLTPAIEKARALIGAHQRPVTVTFNTFHKKIRDPESVKKIASAVFFCSVVFAELQKVNNISVPRLKVNCKRSLALATALVNVAGGVIEYL
jgi:hypothetical protein